MSDAETKAWVAEQPKKLVASKVIIKSTAGNVLLVQPNYKPGWQFPGGGVNVGESPEDAAVREIREELGIELSVQDLKLVGLVYRKDLDNLLPIFEAAIILDESRVLRVQDSELNGYEYVSIAEVGERISEYYDAFWKQYAGPFAA